MFRRIALTGALAGGLFGAALLITGSADAMTFSTPAAVAKAVGESNVDQVRVVCRRVWTRWGWRRSCWRVRPAWVGPGWGPGWGAPAWGWGWGGPTYAWGWGGRPCWNCGWRARRHHWR